MEAAAGLKPAARTKKQQPQRSCLAFSYDSPSADARTSQHWQALRHDPHDRLIHNVDELTVALRNDLDRVHDSAFCLALWSVICGYCEALTTHKDEFRRFQVFPIPIDALRRLVTEEFGPFCNDLKHQLSQVQTEKSDLSSSSAAASASVDSFHRKTVRLVANAVWKKAQGKSQNVRDELHANSLYVCFRGSIDKRSLDCFGAALVTIASLYNVVEGSSRYSFMTLSEDHAYESHLTDIINKTFEVATTPMEVTTGAVTPVHNYATCEIAIAGNTKEIRETRGLDVAQAIEKASKDKKLPYQVTPETSWLYMRKHPVVCHSIPMAIAALIGNMNCGIVERKVASNGGQNLCSAPLLEIKRELLWVLNDAGHCSEFPFALVELGDCEEHVSSSRSIEWVRVPPEWGIPIDEPVLRVELLYLEAMHISRTKYGDAQVYPYFMAGHYHRQAGLDCQSGKDKDSDSQEYRLVEALRLYSEAARVASQYVYNLQLMKHMTVAAMLMVNDILSVPTSQESGRQPRSWTLEANAVAAASWLLAFFDSLLFWEESCGGKQFGEIMTSHHKHSIGKTFQHFTLDVRIKMLERVYVLHPECTSIELPENQTTMPAVTSSNILYFCGPRSQRLGNGSPLSLALGKAKVAVSEMELTIPMSSDNDGRRSKRARR